MKLKMMMLYLCLAALFVSAFGCARLKGESKETVANREVKAALADMASMVEKGQSKEMLEKYAKPESLEQMKANNNLDQFANAMNGPFKEQAVKSLKDMQMQTPVWNDDFTEATYVPAEEGQPTIVFTKIGDKWYSGMNR